MKKLAELKKSTWTLLPYTYFIGLAAFWFVGDLVAIQKVSYVALAVMIGLLALAILQNKAVGTCLGILATVGSIFAFLAVLSEFNDFEAVTQSALELIAVGSVLTLTGLAMGLTLTVTNLKKLVA